MQTTSAILRAHKEEEDACDLCMATCRELKAAHLRTVTLLPCMHTRMCKACIDNWLEQSGGSGDCPTDLPGAGDVNEGKPPPLLL